MSATVVRILHARSNPPAGGETIYEAAWNERASREQHAAALLYFARQADGAETPGGTRRPAAESHEREQAAMREILAGAIPEGDDWYAVLIRDTFASRLPDLAIDEIIIDAQTRADGTRPVQFNGRTLDGERAWLLATLPAEHMLARVRVADDGSRDALRSLLSECCGIDWQHARIMMGDAFGPAIDDIEAAMREAREVLS